MPDPVPPPHTLPDAPQVSGWIDELLQRTRAETAKQSELRPVEVQLAPVWSRMAGVPGVPPAPAPCLASQRMACSAVSAAPSDGAALSAA